ncbi:uncharacterized damage-inducible protein DinB [Jatrophihabitans sp. GAS493]|uniref:mycothiol transferase n=1 Tax=Jatrophihabitans sp. GAS493 TaxID=1907575 RepID=UPI000BB6F720|nr:DUF664 domain-containing protein [Jatrophihabitans sp. GAS493]SOD70995.1 uncharacterized damage-inducible protein DinB [Jatrophihabitans sp. GAS493]
MIMAFPSPTDPVDSRAEVLLRYLDYFRSRIIDKLLSLPDHELRVSRLPTGWTPIELAKHLTFVELRWLEWGFQGREVAGPWGDRVGERFHVSREEGFTDLIAGLKAQGRRTREIVEGSDLDAVGAPGPRWDGAPPATLERILLHLIQEYARHLGQLDIVAEIAGGEVGE